MDEEKRKSDTTVPADLEEVLNHLQQLALPGIKCLGWEPRFLRRQLFGVPVLVLRNAKDGRLAVLGEDGKLGMQDDLRLRAEEDEAPPPPPGDLNYF